MFPGDRQRVKAKTSYSSKSILRGQYLPNHTLSWGKPNVVNTPQARVSETINDLAPVPGKKMTRDEKPCVHVKSEIQGGDTVVTFWDGGVWIREPVLVWAPLPTGYLTMPSRSTNAIPDVLGEFLEGVDPSKDVIMGMPFIKEMKQTRQMIKKPFGFLSQDWPRLARGGREAISKLKKRKVSLGEALTRTGFDKGSNLWLEAHYGWDPLFMDLAAVGTSASSYSSDYDRYINGDPSWTKFRKTMPIYTDNDSSETSSSRLENETTELLKVTGEYRVKPAASTGYALSYPNFLAKKHGLNLSSILTAGWEMVPYSFVLDWLIPVGDLLGSLKDTRCLFDLRNISHHHTIEGTQRRFGKVPQTVHPYGQASPTKGFVLQWTLVARTYSRNWGIPQPSGVVFGGFTTTKVLSGLSLIAQRLHLPLK